MKRLIQNGSLICNTLLVVGGAALGSTATVMVWKLFPTSASPLSPVAVSTVESKKSPPREPALNRRGGDPSMKVKQILAANDPQHKNEDLRRLGSELAETNLSNALETANSLPFEDDKLAFYRGVMETWAEKDPKAAVEYAKANFHAGGLQSEAIGIALGKWGGQDPRNAFIWAEANLTGPVKEEGINNLVRNWTLNSPQDAAKWYEETGNTNYGLLNTLAGAWASNDPQTAAKWVDGLKNPKNREIGQIAVATGWAEKNPAEAAAHFTPMLTAPTDKGQSSTTQINLATALTDIWGTNNPSSASKWVEKLPDGPGREQAAITLANVWAAKDITSAVKWSENLAPGLRNPVIEQLATTWGAIDPDTALAWVQTLPQDLQLPAGSGAYNSWAGTDPVGLKAWIDDGNAAGFLADTARKSLADVYSDSNPQQAIETALQLNDAGMQADMIQRYFRRWTAADTASAQEWLTSEWQQLPTTVQQKLGK